MAADDAGQQRVLRIGLIMRRRSRTGEIEDLMEPGAPQAQARRQGMDDIGIDQLETRFALKVAQVLLAAGLKIVDRDHVGAVAQQGIAKVGAQETGATCYQDDFAFPILHEISPFRRRSCIAKLQTSVAQRSSFAFVQRDVQIPPEDLDTEFQRRLAPSKSLPLESFQEIMFQSCSAVGCGMLGQNAASRRVGDRHPPRVGR